jgi:hypothetical protein
LVAAAVCETRRQIALRIRRQIAHEIPAPIPAS